MKRWLCRLKGYLIVFTLLSLICGCVGGDGQGSPFTDNFDNPRSGWGADRCEESERGYEDGEYFIELHEPSWFAWAYPGEQFNDVSVEVDAHLASGSPDSHFGIICRHADVDNFYYFAISADGFYAIFRRVDGGDLEILSGEGTQMSPSAAIKRGEQVNHLLAVCQGNELSLYANGQLLETVTDGAHTRGDVGLGAGSGTQSEIRVQFDDFAVTEP